MKPPDDPLVFPTHQGIRVASTSPFGAFHPVPRYQHLIAYSKEAAPHVFGLWRQCQGRFLPFLFKSPEGVTVWARFDEDTMQDSPVVAGQIRIVSLVDKIEPAAR